LLCHEEPVSIVLVIVGEAKLHIFTVFHLGLGTFTIEQLGFFSIPSIFFSDTTTTSNNNTHSARAKP
jgi:hypothetical protein